MTVNPKVLPTVVIVLCVLAAGVYGVNKDVRHAIYWLACAVLFGAVTY